MTSAADKEIQAAIKAAEDEEHPKVRYKNGWRISNVIRMYCRPTAPDWLDFSVSYDVVEQWHQWREGKPGLKMHKYFHTRLRAQVLNFTDAAMPGCLLRIEPYTFNPYGAKMRRLPDGWTFRFSIAAKKLGLKPGIRSRRLETLPWEDEKGHILVFEPHEMLYDGEVADIHSGFNESREETR